VHVVTHSANGSLGHRALGSLFLQLLTGETLFDPQSPQPGELYTKDESHLAQVQ
jgi:hypothetical protein